MRIKDLWKYTMEKSS